MSWLHEKTTEFLQRIDEAKAERAFPFFRRFENIGPRVKVGPGSYINFTSNDYLGLSQDKRLIRASVSGTERYGTGLGSARPQATSDRHEKLESRLARWLGYQACAMFTTGYQAMVGTLVTFLDNETTVILDKFSHACILDGVLMAQGNYPDLEVRFFNHNSIKRLERTLKTAEHSRKMVIVEGLYSVDGDIAPLADVVEVCRRYDAVLVVDDAHGLGTIGPTGRGVAEIHRVMNEVDILVGTFSKSFGSVGGFVVADQELIDYLKLQARSFVFSAALPVAQVEAAAAALDIIENNTALFAKLNENAAFMRSGLVDLGFDIGDSETHITPIMVNDERKTLEFGATMFHGAGVIMIPFIYPGVPKGKERLRCNVTAAHTKAEIGYTLEALAKVGQMLEILPSGAQTQATTLQRAAWLAQHKWSGVRNAGLPFLTSELDRAASWAKEQIFGGR